MFKIVSWFTPDYAASNTRLVSSLEQFGYRNHVEYQVEPVGNWAANVMLKPQIIRRAFQEHGCDLVYLDSDAVVRAALTIFDNWTDDDLGAHFRGGTELLGGTLYLAANQRTRDFCEAVAAVMLASVANWSTEKARTSWQVTAQSLLPQHPDLKVRRLPPEYTCILDTMRRQHPGIKPIVEHMQQSRISRKRNA